MKPPTSLYITDDHRVFAEGLESILSQEPDINILGITQSGQQLLLQLAAQPADMVLLDVSMPEMDGYETARLVLLRHPGVKVVMLTMHNSEEHILPLVQLGVHGYVLKNSGKAEVLKAIRQVAQTGAYFSADIGHKLANARKRQQENANLLTTRELEILQLVFQGLSTAKISERLFISPRTVETHRKNILSKTGATNAAQMIHYALTNRLISPE